MRILLINPGLLDDQGRHFLVSREIWFGLTLPHLAGLIPSRHQIKIVDDGVEIIDFTADVDVVMLTAMHSRAERAYQIADEFRARGKRVVMGGLHVSQFPEEALQHVDAVAVGEAEGLIEELIGDLESGRLKPSYRAEVFPELFGPMNTTGFPSSISTWPNLLKLRMMSLVNIRFLPFH